MTSQGTALAQHSLLKRWQRLLLSLTVSLGVGLAPYIKFLLFLFPQSIKSAAILFSTAMMSVIAVYVQFRGSDIRPLPNIEQKFHKAVRWCVVFLALLFVLYFVTVTQVHDYSGTKSFVTGFTGTTGSGIPECRQMSSAQCIDQETHQNEANIDWAFGERQIRVAKVLLVLTYVSFMSTFAYLAALIILKGAIPY